ncbi:TIGR00730 family Rossman fold protein [uncultured Zhongshania sp.]|uniref:LOG family protein n=1 Tax=uncultured Zhongshania sp. TaxID=1642288 RepID=UPI0030D763A6|tara:strand:+ start:2469 stop:3344 length:876 start_codon:yes stop_codon:yes gene_type:complete
MPDKSKLRGANFPSAREEMPSNQQDIPAAYRLAYTDQDFLLREELRGLRFHLELQKPEMVLKEHGVESTIVIFGSARFLSPEDADAALKVAEADGEPAKIRAAKREQRNSHHYQQAKRLGELITSHSANCEENEQLYVVTGGGPGIMEAANRGAMEAGGKSIGLNIVLPHEQEPNRYISPEFCFRFHYFGIRKMHFMLRAKAVIVCPGGFGTFDELFEALTLIQTGKSKRVPIILIGHEFWRQAINLEFLRDEGVISPDDVNMISIVDTAEQAWQHIVDFYQLSPGQCIGC